MIEFITNQNEYWSNSRKYAFRFFCCFFLLRIYPFPVNVTPFFVEINKLNSNILGWYPTFLSWVFEHWITPFVGKYILHLKAPVINFENGSSDTTYNYLLLFTHFLLAVIISMIWNILDRNRKNYNRTYYWLCVLLRYYLAFAMLYFGFSKVFHLQTPFPNLSRLVKPYGDFSPMNLSFSFIGTSKAYAAFLGWSEVICGLLLFFRKTTLTGALFSLVVMGNIVIANFCYDIPVKLYSSQLALIALFLAVPYLGKLYQFFIQYKQVQLPVYQPVIEKQWIRICKKILKPLVICYMLFVYIKWDIKYVMERHRPPLYGIYYSELLIRNHDTIPPLLTDTTSWRQLIVQYANSAEIKLMNDSLRHYNFKIDTIPQTISVYPQWDTINKAKLIYKTDAAYLTLYGKIKEDSVYMRFKKYDINNFRLVNRGFHWITEFPYNK